MSATEQITEYLTQRPTNVVEALSCVMRDLPGIAKVPHKGPDGKGLTYAFRGIEEITAEVQGLFAKYKVVIVPRVRHRMYVDIEVNDRPWIDTYLEVEWSIYGPGGIEDYVTASTFGVGRDNSDKGTNKAMTQAFKYLLLDMLCISDPSDDNDGTTVEAAGAGRPAGTTREHVNGELLPDNPIMESTRSGPPSDLATPKQANFAKALLAGAGLDTTSKLVEWFNVNNLGPWPDSTNNLSKKQASGVIELLKP